MKFVADPSVMARSNGPFEDEDIYDMYTTSSSLVGVMLYMLLVFSLREIFERYYIFHRRHASPTSSNNNSSSKEEEQHERAQLFCYLLHLIFPTISVIAYFSFDVQRLAFQGGFDDPQLELGFEDDLRWSERQKNAYTFMSVGLSSLLVVYLYEVIHLRGGVRPIIVLHHMCTILLLSLGLLSVGDTWLMSDLQLGVVLVLNFYFEQPTYLVLYWRKVARRGVHHNVYLGVMIWNACAKLFVLGFCVYTYIQMFFLSSIFVYTRWNIFWMVTFVPFQILLCAGNYNTCKVMYALHLKAKKKEKEDTGCSGKKGGGVITLVFDDLTTEDESQSTDDGSGSEAGSTRTPPPSSPLSSKKGAQFDGDATAAGDDGLEQSRREQEGPEHLVLPVVVVPAPQHQIPTLPSPFPQTPPNNINNRENELDNNLAGGGVLPTTTTAKKIMKENELDNNLAGGGVLPTTTTAKKIMKKKCTVSDSPSFPVATFLLPSTILALILFYSRGFYQEDPSLIARHHVTIVGGGVSGVLTAYLLDKFGGGKYEIDLFEAEDRLGGAARPLFFGDDGEERIETAFTLYNQKSHVFQTLLGELGVEQRTPDWVVGAGGLDLHAVDDGRNITLLNSDRIKESYLLEHGRLHLLMERITESPMAFLAETSVEDYLDSQGFSDAFRTHVMSAMNMLISGEGDMNLQAFITYYKAGFLTSAAGGVSDMGLKDRNDAHILLMANQTSSRVRYHLNSKVEYFDPSRKQLGIVGGGVWEYDSIVLACRKGAVPEMLRGLYGGSEEYTRGFLEWLGLLKYKDYVALSRRQPSPEGRSTVELRFNGKESYFSFPSNPTILQGFIGGSPAYVDRFLDGATSDDILDYKVWPQVQSDRFMTLFQRNFHKFQYNYETSFVGSDGLLSSHETAVTSAYVVAQDMYGIKFPFGDVVTAKHAFAVVHQMTNFGILYH